MLEPEYRFVRGEGWLPTYEPPYPELTDVYDKWRIRFVQRKPEVGEYFWYESKSQASPVDNIAKAMHEAYWMTVWVRVQNYDGFKREFTPWTSDRRIPDGDVTVVMEISKV